LSTVLATIAAAFADVPRPGNDALLHEQCFDDNDIAALYEVPHWRALTDEMIEREYAALSFLSPDGFRHFIPAYMGFTLRHVGSGAAVVGSTIWSLDPGAYAEEHLRAFTRSKLVGFDAAQRAATIAFLEAVDDEDSRHALAWWRS
jgi:hypothetical protein